MAWLAVVEKARSDYNYWGIEDYVRVGNRPRSYNRLTAYVYHHRELNWKRCCRHKNESRRQEMCGTCELWLQAHEIRRQKQQHAGAAWAGTHTRHTPHSASAGTRALLALLLLQLCRPVAQATCGEAEQEEAGASRDLAATLCHIEWLAAAYETPECSMLLLLMMYFMTWHAQVLILPQCGCRAAVFKFESVQVQTAKKLWGRGFGKDECCSVPVPAAFTVVWCMQ